MPNNTLAALAYAPTVVAAISAELHAIAYVDSVLRRDLAGECPPKSFLLLGVGKAAHCGEAGTAPPPRITRAIEKSFSCYKTIRPGKQVQAARGKRDCCESPGCSRL